MATEIVRSIGLKNCFPEHLRGEDERNKYDFIVSRAVMPLPDLTKIMHKNISRINKNAIPNGIISLKGGELQEELRPYKNIVETTEIVDWFTEEWFKGKYVVYLPI